MSDISIVQTHALSLQQSREAAQAVADQMTEEFNMSTQWQGDVLAFQRDGLSGALTLLENEAQVDVTLGLLFKAFAPMIEEKLVRKMKKAFAAPT
jgi:putative polyhydroxyalkanoate system protein